MEVWPLVVLIPERASPAFCPLIGLSQICCAEPHPLSNEALAQCCGVLKFRKVCLSPASTVGLVGGYVSLWYSLCQAFFSLAAYLYNAARRGGGKAGKGDCEGEEGYGDEVAEGAEEGDGGQSSWRPTGREARCKDGKDGEPQDWRVAFSSMRKDVGALTARLDRHAAERDEARRKEAQPEQGSGQSERKMEESDKAQRTAATSSLAWAIESVGIQL